MKKTSTQYPIFLLYISLAFICFSSMGNFIGDVNTDAIGDTGSCATDCHYKNGGTGNVQLMNVPSTYEPGVVYNMSLVINDTDETAFSARKAGFQVVATDGTNNTQLGTFTDGTDTRLTGNGRIADSPHKFFTGDAVSWTVEWTAPETNAPENIVFYYAAISGDGDGLKDRDIIGQDSEYRGQSNTTLEGALAVDLLTFTFEANPTIQNWVALNWRTNQAIENKGFHVQRTNQIGNDFETIAWIEAKDMDNIHQTSTYQFVDKDVINGETYYYRLQQEDRSGQLKLSEILNVFLELPLSFEIYPNPVSNTLLVTIEMQKNRPNRIRIVDMLGHIVEEQVLMNIQKNVLSIDVSKYNKGTYVVQLFNNETLICTEKLVKN